MLHLYVGVNTAEAKARARRDAVGDVVMFGEGGQDFLEVPTFLTSQGLFSPSLTLLLDRPLESADGKALLTEFGEALHAHTTPVYVIEVSLTVEAKKLFPKGVTVVDFGKKEVEERPMPFALADAFMAGDRKGAWIEYQKLLRAGTSPEEIHGTLSWAVRSALLAAKTKSPDEAGLKPFVYTKSRRAAEKIGTPGVEELSRSLVRIYHRARQGAGDMALGLENLILEKNNLN